MRRSFESIHVVVLRAATPLIIFASAAAAPNFTLQPVASTGPFNIVGQTIEVPAGGVDVTVEVLSSGWGSAPGNPALSYYQYRIDSSGYMGSNASPPNPGVDLSPLGYPATPELGSYVLARHCSVGGRDCSNGQPECAPAEGTCNVNDRFVLSCCDPIVACNTMSLDYTCGGAALQSAATDPGGGDPVTYGYSGTLILHVPSGADGTYTIALNPNSGETFMGKVGGSQIPGLTTTPARIVIVPCTCPDDGNLCTLDTCFSGTCEHIPNYNVLTHCCEPASGNLTTISDGDPCTEDVCEPSTGVVSHSPAPPGTVCGNPPTDPCDAQDTCDDVGACVDRKNSSGTPCGNASDTTCTDPDTCDGAGACLPNHAPDQTACDDGQPCTDFDACAGGICSGFGTCTPKFVLRPVASTGMYSIVGNEIRIFSGGADVTLEIIARNWGYAPGAPLLKVFQASLDQSSYLGANAAPSNPGADLMPVGFPGTASSGAFQLVRMCSIGGRDCSMSASCPPGEGSCILNPRFVLACCNPIAAVNTSTLHYQYGAVSNTSSAATDSGDPEKGYGGTLILRVPASAAGSYTLDFDPGVDETFMVDQDDFIIPGLVTQPAVITIFDPNPPMAASPPHDGRKNRYVSFTPNNGGPVAFRIDKCTGCVSPAAGGVGGWVGVPDVNGIAIMESAPVFRAWTESVVHVGDCEIVPDADYFLFATPDGQSWTPSLAVSTTARPVPKFWADTVGLFGTVVAGQWDPPNGTVNVNDYVAVLQKFLGIATAPHVTVVDVQGVDSTNPCLNKLANIADVFLIIKAFQGDVYPFETNPVNCPACP